MLHQNVNLNSKDYTEELKKDILYIREIQKNCRIHCLKIKILSDSDRFPSWRIIQVLFKRDPFLQYQLLGRVSPGWTGVITKNSYSSLKEALEEELKKVEEVIENRKDRMDFLDVYSYLEKLKEGESNEEV